MAGFGVFGMGTKLVKMATNVISIVLPVIG